jgi:hypothetical protein
MTTPLADNSAVTNPHRVLTKQQKDALGAIAFFRHHVRREGQWQIGNKRFASQTIIALGEYSLVRKHGQSLALTTAGEIALDKLKRAPR